MVVAMMTDTTRALVARLAELLSNERVAFADFIVTLADFDRHRRWAEAGYANLYDFLVRELRMSKGTAFYRKVAVDLVQRYPEVLEPLRDGRLCVTALYALSKAITPENRAEVLSRFFHVSMKEAKAISAEIAPAVQVPRRGVVTIPRAAAALDLGHVPNRLGDPTGREPGLAPLEVPVQTSTPRPPPPRTTVEPLTAQDRRLHLTVTPEFLKMLDACRDALSHVMPGADDAAILREGMKLLLAKDAKKKALVATPRPAKDPKLLRFDSRYIPAEIRRAVWARDQGRCQWPVEGSGICGSTFQPELDHIDGFQPGRPITAKDLRVCCGPHNQEHARQVFGDAYMDQFRRRGRRGRQRSPAGGEREAHRLTSWQLRSARSPPRPSTPSRPRS